MYLSRKSLEREFEISPSTVSRIIRHIRQGSYPRGSILYIGNHPRVEKEVFKRAIADMEGERRRCWTR